jgi:hypothetical protein
MKIQEFPKSLHSNFCMKLKLKVQEIKVNEVMKYGMLMMYETMNKWLVAQDVKQVKAIIKVRKLT